MGETESLTFREKFWAAVGEWSGAHPSVYPIVTTIVAAVGGALLAIAWQVGAALLILVAAVIFAETKSSTSWRDAYRAGMDSTCEARLQSERAKLRAELDRLRGEAAKAAADAAEEATVRALSDQRAAFDAGLSPLIESVQELVDARPSRRRLLMKATYANTVSAISLLVGGNPTTLRTVVFLVEDGAPVGRRTMSVTYERGRRPIKARPFVEGTDRARRPFGDLDDGRTRVVPDIAEDPDHGGLEPNGYRSYASIPIVSTDGYRYGLLSVDSPIVSGLDEVHEPALDVIAGILALALKVHDSAGRRA